MVECWNDFSDVNKDWTCRDKDKDVDQAYKDQDKDFTYSYSGNVIKMVLH